MNAVIIDDEQSSHDLLIEQLNGLDPKIQLLQSAYSVSEGVQVLNDLKPELLFLDIELPDGKGFDVLEKVEKVDFNVIFITAYNHYAQTAIRFGALDYLTKPVNREELANALQIAQLRRLEKIQLQQLEIMKETFDLLLQNQRLPKRISVSTSTGVHFVETLQILQLKALQNFTEFIIKDKTSRLIASVTLKKYEFDLKPFKEFMRVHKSHIINLTEVVRFIKGDKAYVELSDGAIVPVSRKWKDLALKRIGAL